MNEALRRFTVQMADAVDAERLSRSEACSVVAQAVFDAAGRSDLVPRWTRERNVRRVCAALGQRLRVERQT